MFLRAHFLFRSCKYALRSNLWTLTLLFMMMNVSLGRNGFILEISIHYTDYLTLTIKSFTQVKVNSYCIMTSELAKNTIHLFGIYLR